MTIKEIVWLLPLLFILHDMEEIVFGIAWKQKEPSLKKYIHLKLVPFGTSTDTAGMGFAIYEELLILSLSSIIGILSSHYELWFGLLAGNILHIILLHIIIIPLKYHSYVPGFISAAITLFPCIWVFISAIKILNYNIAEIIIYSLIGTFIAMLNLKLLHKNAFKFSSIIKKTIN